MMTALGLRHEGNLASEEERITAGYFVVNCRPLRTLEEMQSPQFYDNRKRAA